MRSEVREKSRRDEQAGSVVIMTLKVGKSLCGCSCDRGQVGKGEERGRNGRRTRRIARRTRRSHCAIYVFHPGLNHPVWNEVLKMNHA